MKRKYKTRLEIFYVPRAVYVVRLKIGKKTIIFDPKDGRKPSVRDLTKTLKFISERKDYIFDYSNVLKNFADCGLSMLRRLENEWWTPIPKYVNPQFDQLVIKLAHGTPTDSPI